MRFIVLRCDDEGDLVGSQELIEHHSQVTATIEAERLAKLDRKSSYEVFVAISTSRSAEVVTEMFDLSELKPE